MKRKILFSDIAVNISILALFLVVISLFLVNNRLIEIHKLNNGYYSLNTQAFSIRKKISTYEDIKKIYSKCLKGTILYKEMSQVEDLRGVLVKGNIKAPPIIEGRFFNENDFYKKKHLAIVGSKQKERMFKKNSSTYIDIGGYPYEVIGIVGSKEKSLLDYTIYVNLDSFSEIDNNEGLFHLDGIADDTVQMSLEELKSNINIINLSKYGIINVFFGELPSFSLLLCIGVSFLLSYAFFTYFWICSHQKLLDVMNIIGSSRGIKFKEIAFLYIKTVLPVIFLISFITAILLTQN